MNGNCNIEEKLNQARFKNIPVEVGEENGAIYSGHLMISNVNGYESDDEASTEAKSTTSTEKPNKNEPDVAKDLSLVSYDQHETDVVFDLSQMVPQLNFNSNESKHSMLYKSKLDSQKMFIDESLARLFDCLTLAYNEKPTSPRWNWFKGLKMQLKDKLRLNNVIWRAWHMQFIFKIKPPVCQFDVSLEEKVPQIIILEGSYWKRRLDTVIAEYRKWRLCMKDKSQKHLVEKRTFKLDHKLPNILKATHTLKPLLSSSLGGKALRTRPTKPGETIIYDGTGDDTSTTGTLLANDLLDLIESSNRTGDCCLFDLKPIGSASPSYFDSISEFLTFENIDELMSSMGSPAALLGANQSCLIAPSSPGLSADQPPSLKKQTPSMEAQRDSGHHNTNQKIISTSYCYDTDNNIQNSGTATPKRFKNQNAALSEFTDTSLANYNNDINGNNIGSKMPPLGYISNPENGAIDGFNLLSRNFIQPGLSKLQPNTGWSYMETLEPLDEIVRSTKRSYQHILFSENASSAANENNESVETALTQKDSVNVHKGTIARDEGNSINDNSNNANQYSTTQNATNVSIAQNHDINLKQLAQFNASNLMDSSFLMQRSEDTSSAQLCNKTPTSTSNFGSQFINNSNNNNADNTLTPAPNYLFNIVIDGSDSLNNFNRSNPDSHSSFVASNTFEQAIPILISQASLSTYNSNVKEARNFVNSPFALNTLQQGMSSLPHQQSPLTIPVEFAAGESSNSSIIFINNIATSNNGSFSLQFPPTANNYANQRTIGPNHTPLLILNSSHINDVNNYRCNNISNLNNDINNHLLQSVSYTKNSNQIYGVNTTTTTTTQYRKIAPAATINHNPTRWKYPATSSVYTPATLNFKSAFNIAQNVGSFDRGENSVGPTSIPYIRLITPTTMHKQPSSTLNDHNAYPYLPTTYYPTHTINNINHSEAIRSKENPGSGFYRSPFLSTPESLSPFSESSAAIGLSPNNFHNSPTFVPPSSSISHKKPSKNAYKKNSSNLLPITFSDDDARYMDRKRFVHITSEHKRRCYIKNGFDSLISIVPHLMSQGNNSKISKVAIMSHTTEYIKHLRRKISEQNAQLHAVKAQISMVNHEISHFQSSLSTLSDQHSSTTSTVLNNSTPASTHRNLPLSGATTLSLFQISSAELTGLNQTIKSLNLPQLPEGVFPLLTIEDYLRHERAVCVRDFNQYLATKNAHNLKHRLFSLICKPLFVTYNESVSTTALSQLCDSVLKWLETFFTLPYLRPIVSRILIDLSTKSTSACAHLASDPHGLATLIATFCDDAFLENCHGK